MAKKIVKLLSATAKQKPYTATAKKKTFCVVCPTWEIKNPDRCSNTIKKSARTLYFCTKRCKERFSRAPEKFV